MQAVLLLLLLLLLLLVLGSAFGHQTLHGVQTFPQNFHGFTIQVYHSKQQRGEATNIDKSIEEIIKALKDV